jgi:hypothetical protein
MEVVYVRPSTMVERRATLRIGAFPRDRERVGLVDNYNLIDKKESRIDFETKPLEEGTLVDFLPHARVERLATGPFKLTPLNSADAPLIILGADIVAKDAFYNRKQKTTTMLALGGDKNLKMHTFDAGGNLENDFPVSGIDFDGDSEFQLMPFKEAADADDFFEMHCPVLKKSTFYKVDADGMAALMAEVESSQLSQMFSTTDNFDGGRSLHECRILATYSDSKDETSIHEVFGGFGFPGSSGHQIQRVGAIPGKFSVTGFSDGKITGYGVNDAQRFEYVVGSLGTKGWITKRMAMSGLPAVFKSIDAGPLNGCSCIQDSPQFPCPCLGSLALVARLRKGGAAELVVERGKVKEIKVLGEWQRGSRYTYGHDAEYTYAFAEQIGQTTVHEPWISVGPLPQA